MDPEQPRFPKGFAARLFIVFGLAAPIATFALAVSGLSVELKVTLVIAVAVVNTLLYFGSRNSFRQENEEPKVASLIDRQKSAEDEHVEHLAALADAATFFNASNDQGEMFGLVASRVNELFPFHAALLLRPSPSNESMVVAESSIDLEMAEGRKFENCLSGLAYLSGEIEVDKDLEMERTVFGSSIPDGAAAAYAIPLTYDGRVLAVFEILATRSHDDLTLINDLEQVRERITPLFLASFASDRSISNALTDSVTEIPNERAFHMVLENQIAESQRFRDERPLTVMAIDLKSFRVVNQQYGHATGDAILGIAAARIRGQLRKMDFLSRFGDDEFVAVLPLVDEKFVDEVSARLRSAFRASKFHVGDIELAIDLNIGSASFWQDGETPEQLIQQAQLRKQHAKAADPNNVVLFPKEYVN